MLLVHEDDQDLILGQAAPLSISTHTHTQPTLLPHQGVAGYAPPPRHYRPPTAELVLLGRRCFAQSPDITLIG